MKINSKLKKAISLLAIVLNAVFFCFLAYKFIQAPPYSERFDWMIPTIIGFLIIINIIALILGRDKNQQQEQGIYFSPRGNSKIRLALMGVTVLVCIIFGFWMGFSSHDKIGMWKWDHRQKIKMAKFMWKKAPDVAGKTTDGKEWRLRDQLGKVVMLDFWATWCGPCVASIPDLNQIYEKYKTRNDFVIVGISLDAKKEDLDAFCKEQHLPWIQLFEKGAVWDNSIARAFEIHSIPSLWMIDKNGNVIEMDISIEDRYVRKDIEGVIEKNMGNDNNEPNL
jgi:peroxiredoxin